MTTENPPPVAVPTTVDGWRDLPAGDLPAAMLAARWYARQEDTVGGWCVMPLDVPPSSGCPTVACFISEQVARTVADRQNTAVTLAEHRAAVEQAAAVDRQLMEIVQDGDVVHVPAGADNVVTTAHGIHIESTNRWGVWGYRITADGKPVKSRSSTQARVDGYLPTGAEWQLVRKCTVLRDGQPIYTPGAEQ